MKFVIVDNEGLFQKKKKVSFASETENALTSLCELLGPQLTPRDVSDSIDHSELGFC
jgi:hypothetical protein